MLPERKNKNNVLTSAREVLLVLINKDKATTLNSYQHIEFLLFVQFLKTKGCFFFS